CIRKQWNERAATTSKSQKPDGWRACLREHTPRAKARFRGFGRDAKGEALAYLDATAKATADSSAALRNDKQKNRRRQKARATAGLTTQFAMSAICILQMTWFWVGGFLQSHPEFYPLPKSAGTGASCRVT